MEGALHQRHAGVTVEIIDRFDDAAVDLLHRREAALDQLAIHEHRAGAAFARAAAFLVARQLE
ncbi:MAG: hypothetical protein Q8M96_13605, partial [Rubrivivax sp.]|nr:hypothetical protein [Rubrivivax sp.]